MDGHEPTRDHFDPGRAEHLHRDDETARRHHEEWQEQARQIENGMADAVERAAAMGDRVEPSLLPPQRRPSGGLSAMPEPAHRHPGQWPAGSGFCGRSADT